MERCRCWQERQMQCNESHYFTDTDVSRYPANVDVGHILLLDDVLQAGLRQLLVVKEGGVGVDVRVGALEWNPGSALSSDTQEMLEHSERGPGWKRWTGWR